MPNFILKASAEGASAITQFLTEDEASLVQAVFTSLNENPDAEDYSPTLSITRPGDAEQERAVMLLNSVAVHTGIVYCEDIGHPVHQRGSIPRDCQTCLDFKKPGLTE